MNHRRGINEKNLELRSRRVLMDPSQLPKNQVRQSSRLFRYRKLGEDARGASRSLPLAIALFSITPSSAGCL